MTLLLTRHRPGAASARDRRSDDRRDRKAGPVVNIALINNMPDKALAATEQQFRRLLRVASGDRIVRLHCFSLPSVPRSDAARQSIEGLYRQIADLDRMDIHGLVVTGAEPVAASLRDEPFWPALAALVDWAARNTVSTIWSCLAAHAAVLCLDGIERRRLPVKCSGLFRCEPERDHWLLRGFPDPAYVPHSRYNALSAADLEAAGYEILSRSREAGVDAFVREIGSEFVFLQGHPEYAASSLGQEYRRDVRRHLDGGQGPYPDWPVGYFDDRTEAALQAFRQRAESRRDPALAGALPRLSLRDGVAAIHQATAEILFTNWVDRLAASTNKVDAPERRDRRARPRDDGAVADGAGAASQPHGNPPG